MSQTSRTDLLLVLAGSALLALAGLASSIDSVRGPDADASGDGFPVTHPEIGT